MIALGGVVVDHVEDDLDAGVVQRRDRGAEIADGVAAGVALIRREEAERVVAPIIAQAAVEQIAVVEKEMHRQELDGGDAEAAQMLDHARLGQPAIAAARLGRNVGAPLGEAFDVGLVDDRVFPGDARALLVRPSMRDVDDHRLVHVARIVAPVEGQVLLLAAGAVAEMRVVPGEVAGQPLAVGVDQQLRRIEAVPGRRLIRPVHAVAVKLPGRHMRQVDVPDVVGALGQRDALGLALAVAVEQAQLDLRGVAPKTKRSWCRVHPTSRPTGRARRFPCVR